MNWKAVVGVSILCITVMTGCTEKKMQNSESNETAKERVQVVLEGTVLNFNLTFDIAWKVMKDILIKQSGIISEYHSCLL